MNFDLFRGTPIPALEATVDFAQSRHAVLAGNLANFDTPGYRTRDLSPERFQSSLKEALAARDEEPLAGRGADRAGRPPRAASDQKLAEVREASKHILYHDDSDLSLEHQVTAISKNQSTHNMALAILSSQFRLLQAAVTERV
jgi:flagellar basal-body rod protein FlgB